MEKQDSEQLQSKSSDLLRRERIFEGCNGIFKEISQQTLQLGFELVGQNTVGRQFQYPQSPIEQQKLLNIEADLERRIQKCYDSESPSPLQKYGANSNIQFDKIICNGSGVSHHIFISLIFDMFIYRRLAPLYKYWFSRAPAKPRKKIC